tara:strand:- start:3433 stop:5340 length:1908 start_codon:yes stop_codon:yes gene_type:complete
MNVLWFKDIKKDDISIVGEKAFLLGELVNNNFPVPPGFVVSKNAFKEFLNEFGIKEKIFILLNNLNIEDNEKLEEASKKIQESILNAQFPDYLRQEIFENYDNLNVNVDAFKEARGALEIVKAGRETPFVVVRSSKNNDFKINANFLNVKGNSNLINAIKKCWSSLFTKELIYDRIKNDISYENHLISVIVQKQIQGDKSGVIYSFNPKNNNNQEVLIEANFGLSETVLSKLVNFDTYVINKDTLIPKDTKIGDKEFIYTSDLNLGQVIKKSLKERSNERVLSDFELSKLVELTKKVESYYGKPKSIEYSIENEKIYFLQLNKLDVPQNVEEVKEEVKIEISEIEKEDEKIKTKVKAVIDSVDVIEETLENNPNGIGLLNLDNLILKNKIHPMKYINENNKESFVNFLVENIGKIVRAFKHNDVWIKINDIKTTDYKNLEGGNEFYEENPLLGWHGIRRALDEQEILKLEFGAVKRLYELGYKNMSIMFPFIVNLDEFVKSKEIAKDFGLDVNNIKFGVVIDTPAICEIIEDLCKEGINFVSFDIKNLTQLTLGVDKNNNRLSNLFDEKHSSILSKIRRVVNVCKEYNIEVNINDVVDPEMIEFLVNINVDSVSVNFNEIKRIRHIIHMIESKEV